MRIQRVLTGADIALFIARIDDAVSALRQLRPPAGAVAIGISLTVSVCLVALFAKTDFHDSIAAESGREMTAGVATGSRTAVERTEITLLTEILLDAAVAARLIDQLARGSAEHGLLTVDRSGVTLFTRIDETVSAECDRSAAG